MKHRYEVSRFDISRHAPEGSKTVVARSMKRLCPVFCSQVEEELNRLEAERERIAAINRELQQRVALLEEGA